MRIKHILYISLALALGGCAGGASVNHVGRLVASSDKVVDVVKNTNKAYKDLSEPEEIELGSGIASNLLGAAPLVKNPEMQRYINRIGLWLALQSERPDLPWHFGVLESSNINAFATPGGYIFITHGLLQRLRNESELAGVLAHEIGHVLQRHHVKAIQKSAGRDALTGLAGLAANQHGGAHAQHLARLFNAGTELYVTGLSKDDEVEADRVGVVLATRAGYNPYGLVSVLQLLNSVNPSDGAVALLFKTHPAPQERLTVLEKSMSNRLDRYEDGVINLARFAKAVK